MELGGRVFERAQARGKLEGLQRQQRLGAEAQNASAFNAIRVPAPALIWWLSDVVCGMTRAM